MDNTLSTQGSHLYPHSFGIVIRLYLKLGIQPVFISIREPWRNGVIEHFPNAFDKMFFVLNISEAFLMLLGKGKGFEEFHSKLIEKFGYPLPKTSLDLSKIEW